MQSTTSHSQQTNRAQSSKTHSSLGAPQPRHYAQRRAPLREARNPATPPNGAEILPQTPNRRSTTAGESETQPPIASKPTAKRTKPPKASSHITRTRALPSSRSHQTNAVRPNKGQAIVRRLKEARSQRGKIALAELKQQKSSGLRASSRRSPRRAAAPGARKAARQDARAAEHARRVGAARPPPPPPLPRRLLAWEEAMTGGGKIYARRRKRSREGRSHRTAPVGWRPLTWSIWTAVAGPRRTWGGKWKIYWDGSSRLAGRLLSCALLVGSLVLL